MDIRHLLSPPFSTPSIAFNHEPQSMHAAGVSKAGRIHRTEKAMATIYDGRRNGGDATPLSPPVTPGARRLSDPAGLYMEHDCDETDLRDAAVSDPVLIPCDSIEDKNAAQPLFGGTHRRLPESSTSLDEIVSKHMAMQMNRYLHCGSVPTRDEYFLAASCVPIVSTRYNANPAKWYRQEQRILHERFGSASSVRRRSTSGVKVLARLAPAPIDGTRKQSSVLKPLHRSRSPRAPKRNPQTKVLTSYDGQNEVSPKRVIGTSREDTDFDALPDFAPSPETLPGNNSKALKTDWKGQILDLSRDPHRHLLYEAEVNLASTLRLSCATYLCSKRRIFMARLDALRIGKEFRKTDSQQACKIDVNKASKLWAAYDRVGWFRSDHFTKFL